MTDIASATLVHGAVDWAGLYVDGRMVYQNHTVSGTDVAAALDDVDVAIDGIERRGVDMRRLGLDRLPERIESLDRKVEFADVVADDISTWEERVRREVEDLPGRDHVMTDEAAEVFGVEEGCGKVVIALLSTPDFRSTRTPLDREPLLELDHDHSTSGAGPAAYRLVDG